MSESFKLCPICGASNHRNAPNCTTCGTTLIDVDTTSSEQLPRSTPQLNYDYRYGETDLLEGNLRRIGRTYMTGITVVLITLMVVGFGLVFGRSIMENLNDTDTGETGVEITDTPVATVNFPTVTPAPPTLTRTPTPTINPTPTPTPTREPCMPVVQAGEGMYNVLPRCGHRFENLDIIDIVVELNDLSSPQDLREGQQLIVPWPTDTPDPNAVPPEPEEQENDDQSQGDAGNNSGDEVVNTSDDSNSDTQVSAFDEDFDPLFVPTATLQPGIALHVVQPNENIITIGLQYGANVEILSQLNPEIAFAQCDFGLDFGGERCTVMLFQGQTIRVPAPTPTPTIPPTPSGSETPTPTATATFNAPTIISPSNRAVFTRDELVTLRWIGSGVLAEGQTYRLRVEDLTEGVIYTANTLQTSFILPDEWQGIDNLRHEYVWQVSVIDIDNPDAPYFTTNSQTFIWAGLGDPDEPDDES